MLIILWLLLGFAGAAVYLAFAHGKAERKIFAGGLVIAALIYLGFAVLAGADAVWLLIEAVGILFYGCFAVMGWYRSKLWLAAGWAAHPLWDVELHLSGQGSLHAPMWYAIACISFDVLVASYIVISTTRERA